MALVSSIIFSWIDYETMDVGKYVSNIIVKSITYHILKIGDQIVRVMFPILFIFSSWAAICFNKLIYFIYLAILNCTSVSCSPVSLLHRDNPRHGFDSVAWC